MVLLVTDAQLLPRRIRLLIYLRLRSNFCFHDGCAMRISGLRRKPVRPPGGGRSPGQDKPILLKRTDDHEKAGKA